MDDFLSTFFNRSFEENINNHLLEYDYNLDETEIKNYINKAIEIPINDYLNWISEHSGTISLGIEDIVQFSNLDDVINNVSKVMLENGDHGFKHYQIGKMLHNDGVTRNKTADTKYGENHAKTAAYLGYLYTVYGYYYVSCIGYVCNDLEDDCKEKLFARLFLRTNLFKMMYYMASGSKVKLRKLFDMLSDSTYIRRISCIRRILKELQKSGEYDYSVIIQNLEF